MLHACLAASPIGVGEVEDIHTYIHNLARKLNSVLPSIHISCCSFG
jgi:hypothetical protein